LASANFLRANESFRTRLGFYKTRHHYVPLRCSIGIHHRTAPQSASAAFVPHYATTLAQCPPPCKAQPFAVKLTDASTTLELSSFFFLPIFICLWADCRRRVDAWAGL